MGGELYLVVMNCNMDDVPIVLCDTFEEAVKKAKATRIREADAINRRLDIGDLSSPIAMSVVTFKGCRPKSRKIIKQFDE